MSVVEATAVVAWCFLVAFGGGVVGLVLGNLRLPVILLFASSTASGGGANIDISGVAATAASVGHLPDAAPDAGLLALGAAASAPGAVLGARFTGRLSERQLVRAIGVALLVAGTAAAVQAVA